MEDFLLKSRRSTKGLFWPKKISSVVVKDYASGLCLFLAHSVHLFGPCGLFSQKLLFVRPDMDGNVPIHAQCYGVLIVFMRKRLGLNTMLLQSLCIVCVILFGVVNGLITTLGRRTRQILGMQFVADLGISFSFPVRSSRTSLPVILSW